MGLDFYVNEHVLIPRPDTELLVEEAMLCISDGMRVLDLCTGSGCILLSLMHYKNGIEGVASDISAEALAVAGQNAERLGLAGQIRFLESDLFEGLEGMGAFDAILSNPPYIPSADIATLMPEVREHEPGIALDGHEDGLYFYRRIIKDALPYLKLSGVLLLEIGYDQAEAVTGLLRETGYTRIEVKQDYGGHDRVVKAVRPVKKG